MKQLLSAALALSLGMTAVAMAQPVPPGAPPPPNHEHGPGPGGPGGPGHWQRGQHFNVPQQQWRHVQNWHQHPGLYAPPPGQEWVQYNNQYVLVAITSGLIGAVLGATAAQP